MGEKKTIYYSRTYRRLDANAFVCIVQTCFLTLPFLLGFIFHIDTLTLFMCRAVNHVFGRVCPELHVFTMTKNFELYGDVSFIAAQTVYPGFSASLYNFLAAAALIAVIVSMPWRGKPMGIYLILNISIHLLSSLWFMFGEDKFPYTFAQYSELYVLQEISILLVSAVIMGAVTGIIGSSHFFAKLLVCLGYIIYAIIFGTVRYIITLYIIEKYSVIYMAAFYFSLGPMLDFVNMVFFSALFFNRMIGVFESAKGKGAWKWA